MKEKINNQENTDEIEKDIQKTDDNLTIDYSNLTIEDHQNEEDNTYNEEQKNIENETIILEIIENKIDIEDKNEILQLNEDNPIVKQIEIESNEEIENLIEIKENIGDNKEIMEEIENDRIEQMEIEEIGILNEENIEEKKDKKDIQEIKEDGRKEQIEMESIEELETNGEEIEELIENKENLEDNKDTKKEEIVRDKEDDRLGDETIYQNDIQSYENNSFQKEYSNLLNDFPQHPFHPQQDNNILAFPIFHEKNGFHNQNVAQLSNPLTYSNDSKSFLMNGYLKQEDDSLYLPKNEIPPLKQNLFNHFSQMNNLISEKNTDFSKKNDNPMNESNRNPPPIEKIPALNLPPFEEFSSPPKSPRYSFAKNEKGELLYDFDPNKKKRERRSLAKDPLKKPLNDKLLPIPLIETPDGSPVEKAEVSFINRIRVGHNRKLKEKEKKKEEINKHFPNQLTEPEPFQLGRRDNLSVSFPQPLIPNHQVFPNYPLRDIVEKKKIEISKKLNKSQI